MANAPSSRTMDTVTRLIGFDTVSRKSNLELIHWARDYLDGLGIASRLVHDDDGAKANLFATIGPEDVPGVVLSGHTDVVPVDGQEWDTDPFTPTLRDGRLYGRGAADMKSFIAVALALVPEMQQAALRRPLHLVLTFDEEVGCYGMHKLLPTLADLPVRPAACIVGEPTEMKIVIAHKGKSNYRCHVHGLEGHSSLPEEGVNAVEAAAEIVAYLKGMARRRRQTGPFDAGFTPPYTTIHTGTIHGGTALNIIPKDCSFDFEFRNLPNDDTAPLLAEVKAFVRDHIEPEMRAVSRNTGVQFETRLEMQGLGTPEDADVVTLAKQLTGSNGTAKVSFGTEGGLYQQAGIPTVICGPGNIEQAHSPNEWIALEQIAQAETFVRRLIERSCRDDAVPGTARRA